jgi:hypothetical protein
MEQCAIGVSCLIRRNNNRQMHNEANKTDEIRLSCNDLALYFKEKGKKSKISYTLVILVVSTQHGPIFEIKI